jgi:hypothetical protein
MIDGQALAPTDFGETDDNGVWQAKEFAGTYGTNGFHLDFSDNSSNAALGTDTSSNGNTWTVNNLSVAAGAGNDSLRDSPSNGTASSGGDPGGSIVGNYATLNPLDNGGNTLSDGNLTVTSVSGNWYTTAGTIGIAPSSGKFYWEIGITGVQYHLVDLIKSGGSSTGGSLGSNGWGYRSANGYKYHDANGSGSIQVSYGNSYGVGDTIGVAYDAANGELTFFKNGASQGLAFTLSTSETYFPAITMYNGTAGANMNFGQRAFAYTAPSGYKSLNTANLPEPTIADGSQYFDTKLYTGNGGTQALTMDNSSMSPDFVWLKARSAATAHLLFDQIRGATYYLSSNASDAETNSPSNTLTSFDSNGFTLGSNSSANGASVSLAAWAWDAGSSTVTNNDGSIASQVRANPSAGFSIVSYTGTGSTATVGHGLGAAPELIITKSRNNTYDWAVYHKSLGITQYLFLNSTAAASSGGNYWNTAPTSTIFGVGNNNTGSSGSNIVAYCFAPVAGYSAMGSYTGNGSADGPFVYTGFRPAFVMIKPLYSYDGGGSIIASTSWYMYDSARGTYNANGDILAANKNYAEENNATDIDFLSNGFKLRNNRAVNTSSGSIYYAVAENPFQANGGLAR